MGLLVGLLGFLLLPICIAQAPLTLRVAVLLWYLTVGAMIGMAGVSRYRLLDHPAITVHLHWWLRGPLIGAWMNFVLSLFTDQQISVVVMAVMGEYSSYAPSTYMIVEGALLGLIIDFVATKVAGDDLLN